jgi:hypothetical protein
MAKTTFVKSARQTKDGERPTCYTCQRPIEVGQSYFWNQPNRFSRRYTWHAGPPAMLGCKAPAPSVLESNEKRSTAMAAFENAYDALDGINAESYYNTENEADALRPDPERLTDDLRHIIEDCGEAVREAAELWRESASNIEDGFGHSTSASDEMNDHADIYDGVADEVDQVEVEVEDFDPESDETFDEWAERIIDAVREALSSAEGSID